MRQAPVAAIFAAILMILALSATALSKEGPLLRVMHLSPDTAQVDIWVDGVKMREYLGYQRTTEYLSLSEGEHRIEVRPYGESSLLGSILVALAPGDHSTVAVTGLSGQNDLQLIALTDDHVAVGLFAKVRFVHTSPGVPALDIAVRGGGPILVSNLGYRQSSDYIQIRPDVYDLEARIAGTTTVLFTIPSVGLSRAANCTIYTTTEGDGLVLKTVHTFETNTQLDYRELLLGITLWAALLAWFVKNHAKG